MTGGGVSTDVAGRRPVTVETVMAWARSMLASLDALDALWHAHDRDLARGLSGRHLDTGTAEDSLMRGLSVVQLGTSTGSNDLSGTLGRASAVRMRLAPFRAHSEAVRREIEEALPVSHPRSSRWGFRGKTAPMISVESANRLWRLQDWSDKTGYADGLVEGLASLGAPTSSNPSGGSVELIAEHLRLPSPAGDPVLEASDVSLLRDVRLKGGDLLSARERLTDSVKASFDSLQDRMLTARLRDVEIDAIHAASRGQVRLKPLLDAGLTSVQDVLDRASEVPHLPGVGRAGRLAVSTAHALRREVRDDLKLRFDLDENDPVLTALIDTLHAILSFDEQLHEHRDELEALVDVLDPLHPALVADSDLAVIHRHSPRRGVDVVRYLRERAAWARRTGLADLLVRVPGGRQGAGEAAWADFKQRSAVYYGLLGEIVGFTLDVDAVQGHLPSEIVAAVERQTLDTSFLTPALKSSLRGYQSFGARYTLVQRRVLLGDEMGLGKTIQAIAAMAHLAAHGADHFVVVCPPAVLVNWIKEVRKHSRLEVHRIHGPVYDRERALRGWRARGGVAITSFNLASKHDFAEVEPDLVVVDEAHFVKNPSTQRAETVRRLVGSSDRALFMTGTPLENRVEDFVNLVTLLQPDVLQEFDPASMVVGARKFREAVAPVYLRRNSDDVLSELPDRVEVEDWVDMSSAELAAYAAAVQARDFHAMRRTAFVADPRGSQKLERLEEIVDEASSNGRKVLVFSTYLDVIQAVTDRLGDRVAGVITGAVAPDDRQRLVDRFSDPASPSVLIGQVTAAGVGLNLQAASVVILCEPQVKPSLEDQAVKRAHRMGQLQGVQVHRLLTTDSVDERMQEILAVKARLFAQFAAQSEVAEASPQATDITEAEVAKEVIAKEQARLADKLRGGSPATEQPPSLTEAAGAPGDGPTPVESNSAVTPPPQSIPPRPAPRPEPKPTSRARPAPDHTSKPTPAPPRAGVQICPSCNRPIGPNAHCGCS